MSKEPVVLGEIIGVNMTDLSEKDLPGIIHEQIKELDDLEKTVGRAMNAAEEAKNSAESAKEKSAGFGKKKAAIEELQSAGLDLAKAVQLGVEAHKISFEYQTKLAKISKYLFGLGANNIASNRVIVRELEMRLKGASQAELSELARQELITVVKQLKDQEDLLKRLENIAEIVKNHNEILKVQSQEYLHLREEMAGLGLLLDSKADSMLLRASLAIALIAIIIAIIQFL